MLINDKLDVSVISLPNFAANGAIGTAANTVDICSHFHLTQVTPNVNLSIPSPTDASASRLCLVVNTPNSTAAVNVAGQAIEIGKLQLYAWSGTAWTAQAGSPKTSNTQTVTAYTTLATDSGNIVTLNNAAAITVTLSNLTANSITSFVQLGAGQVTFVSGNRTVRHVANLSSIAGIYGRVDVLVVGTDAILSGDMS